MKYIFIHLKSFQVPPFIMTIMSLNHFLLVLKSSINLLIIFITGSEFRKTFYLVFGINKQQDENRHPITITNNVPENTENTQTLNMTNFRETQV